LQIKQERLIAESPRTSGQSNGQLASTEGKKDHARMIDMALQLPESFFPSYRGEYERVRVSSNSPALRGKQIVKTADHISFINFARFLRPE